MNQLENIDDSVVSWVNRLSPYVPGLQPKDKGWVKLNTNENPYPPSAKVLKAINSNIDKIHLYPEPKSSILRKTISKTYGFKESNVLIGNGSDNILDLIARSFVGLGNAGHTIPSYSLYPVVVGMSGGDIIDIPFDRSMKLPVDEIIKMDAPVFYLTNPNAPTGVCFDLESIELVLKNISGLLVVDEAYIDFGGISAVSLMGKYKNIIIVRSFSKSYSLAGLRVGFALASSSIISVLDKVRDAYNVSCISQAAATAAYLDKDTFTENCQKIIKTRNLSEIELSKMKWKTYPSKGNYLFTEPIDNKGNSGKKVAKDFYEFLKSNKILVRYFENNSLTCSFIRVSIGTDDNMAEFFRVIRLWQKIE